MVLITTEFCFLFPRLDPTLCELLISSVCVGNHLLGAFRGFLTKGPEAFTDCFFPPTVLQEHLKMDLSGQLVMKTRTAVSRYHLVRAQCV